MFKTQPDSLRFTLRVLARLLSYPDDALREQMPAMVDALRVEQALPKSRVSEIDAFCLQVAALGAYEAEARYVDTFDRGHKTSLHLFEHVHGDSRDRGPALVDLQQTYEKAGLMFDANELPDHLPVVLEFASTQPVRVAQEFLGEMAHILNALFSALLKRGSPYACIVAAVLEVAGERAQAVEVSAEPDLDESWIEPEAFNGCSSQGQAKPGQEQPLHFVRKATVTTHQQGVAV